MTNAEAKKFLAAKLECMERYTSTSGCDDECEECDLCYEQGNMGEQKEALRVAIKSLEPKTGHWHRLPDTIGDLQDHYYYLVVYPPYKTPMKAKYHIGERMDILGCGTEETVFFNELGKVIKWWTELPEMPQESEDEG